MIPTHDLISVLRLSLLLILITLLMPWGAFSAHNTTNYSTGVLHEATTTDNIATTEPECRLAALLGSSCALDFAACGRFRTYSDGAFAIPLIFQYSKWLEDGLELIPPTGPPRIL